MPRAKINNIDLNWEEAGSGDPLLLLHGFPLDHTIWHGQIEYFAKKGWKVIAPDQRGYGQSSLLPGNIITMTILGQDASALLKYLEIDQAVVVGLSMGGYVSFAMLRQFPELIRALILVSTKAEPDTPTAQANRYKMRDEVQKKGSIAAKEVMLPGMFAPEIYLKNAPLVEELGVVMEKTDPETIIATLPGLAERPDSTSLLHSVDVPVLVIHGESDRLIPIANAREMAAVNPKAKFIAVAGAGHMANLEKPEFFNQSLEAFLQASL